MNETEKTPIMAVRDCARETGNLGKSAYARALYWMGSAIQAKSEGAEIADTLGRRFVDVLDSYGNQAFGYRHPAVVEAALAELNDGVLHNSKLFFNEKLLAFNKKLAALTDNRLPHAFLCNGGAEAIETALKLARGVTGRPKFVSARNSYHGMTFGAMSASHRPDFEELYKPMLPNFVAVEFGSIEDIENAVDDTTAAVILETVQAEGGVRIPPPTYFERIRSICDEVGAILILDEIQTAFGRTGRLFAFEHFNAEPDIVCIGKSLGGGILPISGALCTPRCWSVMQAAPFSFASSLAGSPLAVAVADRVLDIAVSDEWLRGAESRSLEVSDMLSEIHSDFPDLVSNVEGFGLLWGIRLRSIPLAGLVCWLLSRNGVLTSFSLFAPDVIRIQPPLVITDSQMATVHAGLKQSLQDAREFLERQSDTHDLFSMRMSEFIDQPLDAVFELFADQSRLYRFLQVDAEEERASPTMNCRAIWDGLLLEWTDEVEIDRSQKRIVQRARAGDWKKFDRVWSFQESRNGTTVECLIDWDAGCDEIEFIIAFRVKYLLEQILASVFGKLPQAMVT